MSEFRLSAMTEEKRFYALATLPAHLAEAGQYDRLVRLLTDLRFVEAKCAAGLVYDLEADYDLALAVLPESQEEQERVRAHQQEVARYTQDLIAYAQAWSEARARHEADPAHYPLPAPEDIPLPTIATVRPWTDDEIRADTERIIRTPNSLDRLRAFAAFVEGESHHLTQFATQPGFCVQQAYNSADAGPVVSAAERLLEAGRAVPLLLQPLAQRASYTPHPALLRTLEGHTKEVMCVSVTPDGQTAVSGGGLNDGTVRVWDLASGKLRHTLAAGRVWDLASEAWVTGPVNSVSVTPDGRTAISGGGTMRVWDLASGACLHTLEDPIYGANSVSVTPDGRTAISGGGHGTLQGDWYGTLRVWDLTSGTCRHILKGHTWEVTSVSVTPDGRTAISGSHDKTVWVWGLISGVCLLTLEGHTDRIESVSVTPDGRTAISGSLDKTVRVWDLVSGTCRHILKGHTDSVTSVSVTPDGRTAISGSWDGTVRVWDLASGTCRHILKGHTDRIESVSVTPDGRIAVSGSWDHTVRVWDLVSGQSLRTLEGHTGEVASMSMTPDGQTAASGGGSSRRGRIGEDYSVRVWDLASGACRHILEGHTDSVNSVSVTPDGRTAVSGSGFALWGYGKSEDNTVRVWDLASGACRHILKGHTDSVTSVSVTPDGRIAVSGSNDHTVRVWDLVSGKALHTLVGHTREVTSVCMTPDGRTAVSGGGLNDHTVRVWDLASGELRHTLVGHTDTVNSVSVTPDGQTAVSGGGMGRSPYEDYTLWVLDLTSGACLRTLEGHTNSVTSVSVTPDGRTAISGSWDRTVRVWDLVSGACRYTLEGHTDTVWSVSVTPDGQTAVSRSWDGTVRVWDLAGGQCLAIFPALRDIRALSEIAAGGQFGFGTESGQVIFVTLRNIHFAPPHITAVRLWLFGAGGAQGRWDNELTTRCAHCGQPFVPAPHVLDAIQNITAHLTTEHSSCLELPTEAWDEPQLLSECPNCHQQVRFNPFVVDRRKTKL